MRAAVENPLGSGWADELRDNLVSFALSRVDWLQLAHTEVERVTRRSPSPRRAEGSALKQRPHTALCGATMPAGFV
jgi:hypothetical protein